MITCIIKYEIDPYKISDFTEYAKMWIPLVKKYGGIHHGYYLPNEGTNYKAYSIFSFPSLAKYEIYRNKVKSDKEYEAIEIFKKRTKCINRIRKQFMTPIFD